ncbi:TonB-dependent receptor [Agaribacter flavus]|uniref:TonB-dependent receptor n=1 Tax=Agaribacter flavus TaxID=1902781 RepID=A0ABV7FR27_9ALTE
MDTARKKAHCVRNNLLKYTSIFPLVLLGTQVAISQENNENNEETTEHIEVKGTYKALSEAAALKRSASQIVDAISAADIGKLPDTNIAEALQRVTGITIGRDDAGDGTSFQIRGFSENSLTINGKGVVTDGFDDRENNLNALSSALVKNIVVSKTPTADQIEGGSGGSVELTTFSPLDFDDLELRVSADLNDNSLKSDPSAKISGLYSDRITLDGAGELGFLINLEKENRNTYSEGFSTRYGGTDRSRNGRHDPVGIGRSIALLNTLGQAPLNAAFIPRFSDVSLRDQEIDTDTISGAIEWAPTENFSVEFKGSFSEYKKANAQSNLRLNGSQLGGNRDARGEFGVTLEPGATWDTLVRPANANEYDVSTFADNYTLPNGNTLNSQFTSGELATGDVMRSMLTSGIFLADSENNNQNSPFSSRGGLFIQEKSQTNVGIDIDWYVTDDLLITAQVGRSESETDNLNRRMELHLETEHPVTGRRLYPSLRYDIRNGGNLPEYELLWREPVLDENGNRIGGRDIAGFAPDYLDPVARNDLHRLHRLDKSLSRTRGTIDEARFDVDWDVELGGITRIEFGGRYDSLENFKDRSDFRTPFVPGFEDNDADGIPDDLDGDGLPDNPERRGSRPNRTLTSLIEDPLVGSEDAAFSSVTPELLDRFFLLRDGLSGVSSNFPGQFWGTTDDAALWDETINSVYGGHEVLLNELQTEKVFEDTTAFYLKLNFEYEVAGMPLTGNIGVRHGKTTGQSEAFIAHCNMPWLVDAEKTAIVRQEQQEFRDNLQAWIDGGEVGEQPTLTPSFWDRPLSTHQGRNDPLGAPERMSFCNTRLEPGGDQVAVIFQDDPWVITPGFPAQGILRTGTPNVDGTSLWKDYLASEYEYDFTLPSLNLNLGVADDMYVRFAAYKTIARPGPNDLSLDPANRNGVFTQGNPNLKPYETESFDISWEWYISQTDNISLTYFSKDLLNQKIDSTEFNVDLNRLVSQPINGGDGKVDGIEFSTVHTFGYLPEVIRGFGVQLNYTIIDSEQSNGWDEYTGFDLPIVNRSDETYNIQFFYENHGWSARLAYNWRDSRLHGAEEQSYRDLTLGQINDASTAAAGQNVYNNFIDVNPRSWYEDYAQLDFTLGYDFSDNLSVVFKASNITEEVNRAFTVIPEATREYNLAASFYRLSVSWKL